MQIFVHPTRRLFKIKTTIPVAKKRMIKNVSKSHKTVCGTLHGYITIHQANKCLHNWHFGMRAYLQQRKKQISYKLQEWSSNMCLRCDNRVKYQ